MPYAKPCKYCNVTQVVWDDKLEGGNKFKEVKTNLPHTRERCDAAKGQKSFEPQATSPEREYAKQQEVKTTSQSLESAAIIERLDKISLIIRALASKDDQIMEILQTSIITNKEKEIAQLRQKVTELEAVIKKEGMGLKNAAGESLNTFPEMNDERVERMVNKGKTEEEFEV